MSLVNPLSADGVVAVFVTMNRCATAATCLDRLLAQTARPGRVIVVNNASTDGSLAMLRDRENEWLEVVDSKENLGNAGGIRQAMDKAFGEGCDAVWILDDDSWPEPDALRLMVEADVSEPCVRSCKVVDIKTGELSWPLQIPSKKGFRFVVDTASLPDEQVIPVRRAWLGALIPRAVFEEVGPVERALFLRGEDEDYPRRIERAGFPVFLVRDSVLHHPAVGKLNYFRFFGREIVLEQGLEGDKLFYRLRNACWVAKRQDSVFHALFLSFLHVSILCTHSKPFWKHLPIWWEATRDAMMDRLGRRKR